MYTGSEIPFRSTTARLFLKPGNARIRLDFWQNSERLPRESVTIVVGQNPVRLGLRTWLELQLLCLLTKFNVFDYIDDDLMRECEIGYLYSVRRSFQN